MGRVLEPRPAVASWKLRKGRRRDGHLAPSERSTYARASASRSSPCTSEENLATDVTVVGPVYWADHAVELSAFLHAAKPGTKALLLTRVEIRRRSWPRSLTRRTGPTNHTSLPTRCVVARRVSQVRPFQRCPNGTSSRRARRRTQDRLTMSVEEAAAALGIGPRLTYEAVQRGEIPSIHIGRRILVPRSGFARMLRTLLGNQRPTVDPDANDTRRGPSGRWP